MPAILARLAAVLALLATSAAALAASHPVELDFFYGSGCPHCAAMQESLQRMQGRIPELRVREHEVYFDRENARLLERVTRGYGVAIEGVPTTFVGDVATVGYSPEIEARLEKAVRDCAEHGCASPLSRAVAGAPPALTVSAVVAGAAVDSINPCEFAVLIMLVAAILGAGGRKRALAAGLAYSLSVFISYYLMGLGLYSAVQAAGVTRALYLGIAWLAIAIGLFNLKDFLWYGKWFAMEVPQGWRPALKRMVQGVTSVPGAFLVGFAVSLFLLPCTSGPYVVILGLLARTTTRGEAALWLLLYNAIFILPMVLITVALHLGWTTTEKLEAWRTRSLESLHLAAGIVLVLLGAGMLAWLGVQGR